MEDGVDSLETASERHEQTITRLEAIAENQDQLLDRLVGLLEELTRDTVIRRLWLRLAQHYG